MTKNLVLAALLSTAAAFSYAQAPATKPIAPVGAAPATVTVETPKPMAAAKPATPAKKQHAKKHAKKKLAKMEAPLTK